MKTIQKIMRSMLLFLSTYVFTIFPQPVNPQPGENIWHITAAIGTEVDLLVQNHIVCCVETYTTLAQITAQGFSIESKLDLCCSTLNSKIDTFSSDVQSDFDGTFTAIAAISAANFSGTYTLLNTIITQDFTTQSKLDTCCTAINSKIDILGSCNPIPLIINPEGVNITNSGYYCLSNEVILTGTISIAASDVVLDLNNHTVNGGFGILINPSFNRITIKNGNLVNNDTVITTSSNADITISDLQINNCNIGFSMNYTSNILVENIEIYDAASIGMFIFGCRGGTIQNCNAIRSATSTPSVRGYYLTGSTSNVSSNISLLKCNATGFTDGFFTETTENITLDSCTAQECNSVGMVIGGNNQNNSTLLKNCSALNCGRIAFSASSGDASARYVFENCSVVGLGTFSPSLFTRGFFLARPNGIIKNCSVTNNGLAIGFQTTTGSSGMIINCVSQSLEIGFSGFNVSSNWIWSNCTANFNTSIGFDFTDSTISNMQIAHCTATNNGVGFAGNGANTALFYLNTAANNTTNYSGITFGGSQSAPENTFTSLTRLYGDNLKNI